MVNLKKGDIVISPKTAESGKVISITPDFGVYVERQNKALKLKSDQYAFFPPGTYQLADSV